MCRVASFKPSQPQPDGRWFAVVPVLFLDFLVMALPGGILPIMLNDHYGPRSYIIVGYAQSLKGMLAFIGAPIIGALSDVVGRKHLFLTCVLGTASPYAALGLGCSLDTHLALFGLSGMLAATFPLAFAYICDVVPEGPAQNAIWREPRSRHASGEFASFPLMRRRVDPANRRSVVALPNKAASPSSGLLNPSDKLASSTAVTAKISLGAAAAAA